MIRLMTVVSLALTVLNPLNFSIVEEYDVDPDFARAVAVVESGWEHDSRLARKHNNIFGLVGKSFKSKNDCIHYFGQLMNGRLYKGKTIDEIAKIYCPHNPKGWSDKVKSLMDKFKSEKKVTTLEKLRRECGLLEVLN